MIDFVSLRAAIFDMDGLLVDTEPLWRKAEVKVFQALGLPMTEEMTQQTTGLRVDEVVEYWRLRYPWSGHSNETVAHDILDKVTELILKEGRLLPGVHEVLDVVKAMGLKVALASSSPLRLIDAVLDHFELRSCFEVVESAEREQFGKPHPAVFIRTAERLGVKPVDCLVFEDSVNGMVAAKAAKMACVVVPAPDSFHDIRFGLADMKLTSLLDFQWEG